MNQEGHPKDIKSNWKGVNHNTEREISGAGDDGEYLDGKNGRVTSIRGNNMSFEKIRGEEELHTDGAAGLWECIGSISVKDQLFEIWADATGAPGVPVDPIIKVDGVTVANSPGLPFVFTKPVQMDKNDNCLGGEVFITDNNTPPIIFDVKDMVDSVAADPTKYFADFNIDLYTINLDAPLDIPIFKELVSVGGGASVGGKAVGSSSAGSSGERVGISVAGRAASSADVSELSSVGELPPRLHAAATSRRRMTKNIIGGERIFFMTLPHS